MSRTRLILPSFAKVNLGLKVISRRPDGFHDIFTVFQTISLKDTITFAPSDKIRLTCTDPNIPVDGSNIILKAVDALKERYSIRNGVTIHLDKKIPSPGGLGGGSSNAAVTLLALRRLWGLDVSTDDLVATARSLGSDVPFFLVGGTAIGSGRGTEIEPIDDIGEAMGLVVTPDIDVSTAEAYQAMTVPNLTNREVERILLNCRFEAKRPDFLARKLINDFEKTVFARFPDIGEARQTLADLGASPAMMCGSGASVFGFFDKEETRQTAIKALGEHANWRSFAVATISRREYREALRQVF